MKSNTKKPILRMSKWPMLAERNGAGRVAQQVLLTLANTAICSLHNFVKAAIGADIRLYRALRYYT